MGRLLALGLVLLALLGACLGVAAWWQGRGATHQLAKAEERTGLAVVAAGQSDALRQADQVLAAGKVRAAHAAAIHTENAHAILTAPGAGQVLDPGFVRRLDGGLCRYATYRDDPGCAGLRQPDPAVVSPADPLDPPS